ncbi:hypothetical protein WH96_04355 [Kiloniella spongiae]|uniref:Uncharacterized protein n=1 Tax=Kiloniella spongiae TaxID=1489064 RepID=A0A0H2MLH3_9PROT|nr:hypothetical protein [Kiloniella spongiae]KLN61587.1 hypothetical protein WH96_04355 [Kiloniella spongiae]
MPNTAKVRKVGNSLSVTLTDVLKRHRIDEGDTLYISETPSGIMLQKYDPDFETAMEAAREIMDKHPNMMKELAK